METSDMRELNNYEPERSRESDDDGAWKKKIQLIDKK